MYCFNCGIWTTALGFIYDTIPMVFQNIRLNTNTWVTNNDNRAIAQFTSFNGLVWKKGIDETWLLNCLLIEPEENFIRYAYLLLLDVEAKIGLKEIDNSVLEAMNAIRARDYGVIVSSSLLIGDNFIN
jgi:hypothetical protein